ncbi:DUF4199 domain-containing protein (plasmid) [Pedobacter sp. BS3]|uniref:DUF4199 domain-containing protein n=1 Tax=Pedobacter sp. BS3 TaxID=2567937 RepID=UPI0011EDC7E1|nr:DUF4199 domain-containing protein [Pedobacter sp. BS3]TZF85926.1 DUF4199 domain-containing protein [Pedobacter sp. BS3]
MRNAILYGLVIGVASGIWLLIMHFAGVFNYSREYGEIHWMEYASLLIPLAGLYFGVQNFRDNENDGTMEFFEGLFEGFKILVVGAVITAFFLVMYFNYVAPDLKTDYIWRMGAGGVVGILFDLMVALLLMNKQKRL